MRNTIIALALSVLMIPSLCLCAENAKEVKYDEYTKVAPNLYEVTCDEYDYDYLLKEGKGNVDFLYSDSGCSAIKEGNYLGRNFDFIAGDASEIVVKTTAKKDRYASVGMVGGLMWLTTKFMDNGLDEDAKKLIPLMVLDGINEKGLAIETNCVNATDVGGLTKHTNPGKKEIAQLCVVRYLLDHAATADEAIELMKSIDIVNNRDVMGLIARTYEVHFLITDKNKTYVVELDNNKPEGEKLVVMENETIMTNFYLHLADTKNNTYAPHSLGIERYRKLADNRSSVNSVETMKQLMQSIRFTNSNRLDGEYEPGENYDNPYTCLSDHPEFGENPINYANHREHLKEVLEVMKRDSVLIVDVLKDPEMKNPTGIWCTSHNSVFDLENNTMSVAVFERYDKYYDYSAK